METDHKRDGPRERKKGGGHHFQFSEKGGGDLIVLWKRTARTAANKREKNKQRLRGKRRKGCLRPCEGALPQKFKEEKKRQQAFPGKGDNAKKKKGRPSFYGGRRGHQEEGNQK